jgi:hypothetical protein
MELKTYQLGVSAHAPGNVGCVNEIAAMLADEPWSDKPLCVSPVLGAMAMAYNDAFADDEALRNDEFAQELPWILVGTNSDEHEQQRIFIAIQAIARCYWHLYSDLDVTTNNPAITELVVVSSYDDACKALLDVGVHMQWQIERCKALHALGRLEPDDMDEFDFNVMHRENEDLTDVLDTMDTLLMGMLRPVIDRRTHQALMDARISDVASGVYDNLHIDGDPVTFEIVREHIKMAAALTTVKQQPVCQVQLVR